MDVLCVIDVACSVSLMVEWVDGWWVYGWWMDGWWVDGWWVDGWWVDGGVDG